MNEVILIAGKLQGNNTLRFWKLENKKMNANIGDYAIVENQNSYNLIEILGVVITTKDKAISWCNCNYENIKNVIKFIKLEELIKK